MIVVHLCDTQSVLDIPTIHKNRDGTLELCEDGVSTEASEHLVYACPDCDRWLFQSSELRWANSDGYWKSPAHTLQKPCYDIPTEIIKCVHCDWTIRLFFFSYGG